MVEEPHQMSGYPELADYKQSEHLPSAAGASPVPSASVRPWAQLQEHTQPSPSASAHTSAAGTAGWEVSAPEGTSPTGECNAVKSRLHFPADLCQAQLLLLRAACAGS